MSADGVRTHALKSDPRTTSLTRKPLGQVASLTDVNKHIYNSQSYACDETFNNMNFNFEAQSLLNIRKTYYKLLSSKKTKL